MKLSATVKEAAANAEIDISQEEDTEARFGLSPNLQYAKTAVLNSLTSARGQRTYDHTIREFVAWYCSEPRLAYEAADAGLLSPEIAAGIRRVKECVGLVFVSGTR